MTWNKTKHSLMALLVASVAFIGCSEETTEDPMMDAGAGGTGGMGAGGMGAGGMGAGGMGAGGMGAGGMGAGGMGAGGMGAGGMGEGGMGGMVEDLCDGADYVDFNATAVEADGVWTFEGMTGADDFLGTCGDSMQDHADIAVLFEAPEAGFWEFQTAGSVFDTLIYVREDCADPNSELACNDDYNGVEQSRVVAHLEAGQRAFVIVDTFRGLDANPFTLTAQTVTATPPTADMLTANYNPDQGSLGFTLTGTDPEDDVATYTLRLIDAAGETVQLLGEDAPVFTPATQGFTNLEAADGSYTITFDAFLPPDTGNFASIEVVVSDEINLASDPITADAPLPPELMPDAECDPIGARNICPEEHVCYDPMGTGTVTCMDATAPELMTLEAFYNAETNVVAFTATGIDPENDVVGIKMKLLDANGDPLSFGDDGQGGMVLEFEGTFDDNAAFVDAEQADGNFTLTASAGLPDEFAGQVNSIELIVTDSAEQESASVAADTQMPGVVESGEPCDPLGGFNTCMGEMDVCYEADVHADEPAPICQLSTVPVITGGDAYSDGDFLGVRFEGMDPENDVVAISIALLDNEGAIIEIEGQNGPLLLDFDFNTADISAADGAFMGFWGADFFAPAMVAPAQLQITALDNAGNESEPVVLDFGAERLMFAADEFCDSSTVVGDCADDLFCIANDGASVACVEPVVECPADWEVVDLSGALDGGLGAYMGDSTGHMSVAGSGTCGGGGPQDVLSYVAPAAGLYTFEISLQGQGDTLIFARSFCGYEGGAAELACNDDIEQGNLLSRLAIDLEAGQQIFIFIDGYTGRGAPGFAGPYTLTVANSN